MNAVNLCDAISLPVSLPMPPPLGHCGQVCAQLLAFAQRFEIEDAHALLARLEGGYPNWFARFDSIVSHPLSHERAEVLEAMAEAPDAFLRGMLYSAYVMALQIEQITGRA